MKVYNVPSNSPVALLIDQIETEAMSKGLTLSRFQANGQAHKVTVTYVVHSGERAAQARYQTGIVAECQLKSAEGHTEKSAAFKALATLLSEI
jgi:hypothetical protein